MDFSHYLFRCSALGHLMQSDKGSDYYTIWVKAKEKYDNLKDQLASMKQFDAKNNQLKSYSNKLEAISIASDALIEAEKMKDVVVLSEGAKTHLMDIWISETKRRKADITNKYIEKGLSVEEDGITLYSRIKKVFFVKNEQDLKNLYIKGTPDSFVGNTIMEALRIIDIKCSWTANTFYRTFIKTLNPIYYWQGMGYMWLTGAKYFDLAYCLVNTPAPLIEAEKRSIWYKLGQPSEDDGNFIDACAAIERNMIFDDIPLREKMLEYSIEYNEADIELAKKKIIAGRAYLNQLEQDFKTKFYPQ